MEAEWFVYMIEAENGRLYTGITTDTERRWLEHQSGKGAKFFRSSPPKRFRLREGAFDRSTALRLESRIKRLPRAQKLELCRKSKFQSFFKLLSLPVDQKK
jgi:putative endonuclease